MHFRVLVLATVLAAASFAGCTRPEEAADGGNDTTNLTTTPTGSVTPGARFRVAALEILHPDGRPGPLYEDAGGALIRYTIEEPADAPGAETAFVTFKLNGRIVDVQQLKLEPGQNRTFERTLGDVRDNRTIRVEVIAGSSSARAETTVQDWPRAGRDTLTAGPLQIRADFGLMEHDGRVLINLTLKNVGPEQEFRDFRAKMLCAQSDGSIRSTNSVRIPYPSVNNSTGVDAILDDCGSDTRYGVEFKASGDGGVEHLGRLLLVPDAWRPTPA